MKTYIVDSFTNEPFKGNPAGVCLLDEALSEFSMLAIAKELGFSETAFVQKLAGEHNYAIRFFSPKMEIPLCGHATLAASKVLFENNQTDTLLFKNIQHLELPIRRINKEIQMEFPVYSTRPANVPAKLLGALGIQHIENAELNVETNILLLEIDDTAKIQQLDPDFNALFQSTDQFNGVLVTAPSRDDQFDFHSRYFWPWSGTNEDPVTGGTHTFLAPYWSERLQKKKMKSFQSSKRTGFMEIEIMSDSKLLIRSEAVIVFAGELMV